MTIVDKTSRQPNPCIWIEDGNESGDIEVSIKKDFVEIEWRFCGSYEGGDGTLKIERTKLIELLLKMG